MQLILKAHTLKKKKKKELLKNVTESVGAGAQFSSSDVSVHTQVPGLIDPQLSLPAQAPSSSFLLTQTLGSQKLVSATVDMADVLCSEPGDRGSLPRLSHLLPLKYVHFFFFGMHSRSYFI